MIYYVNYLSYKIFINIIDFLNYFKYFIYFNSFLFIFFINLLNYKISSSINNKLINLLYYLVKLNGCVLIKFLQWITTNLDLLDIDNYIQKLFLNFYENCNIHSLNYTKKIFKKELNFDFDEIIELDHTFNIKSASIAQVYKGKFKNKNKNMEFYSNQDIAIKVVHPEVKYQIFFPIFFIKLYKFLVTYIWFLKKYNTIFNFESFFNNLKKQLNMINEFNNMTFYYNYYKNNEYIIIPEPILCSNNILIMEFIDGKLINDIEISDFKKQKIIGLLALFVKENYMFLDYYHSDLHDYNWKIKEYKDFYQLIIYDFGYICKNYIQNISKSLIYNLDTNNIDKLAINIYNNIDNTNFNLENFIIEFKKYLKSSIPYSDDHLKKIYSFCYNNNIQLKNNLLELFISMILLRKNYNNFIFKKISDKYDVNFMLKINYFYIQLCDNFNIFENVKNYLETFYIESDILKNKFVYNDKNFNNLIIQNSEKNNVENICINI